MTKFNIFTVVFNPSVGDREVLLCSVEAPTRADAKAQGRRHLEPGETLIVRLARQSQPHPELSNYA